ncbi:hypothetical protein LWF01_07505 [Saxibacter everestensis]|uniref:Maltokinase N-terminal cap domain-containing protein n=1 Tax=Saxibacter everestensis TaxID=2909229 RepID=A0ABY8QXD8_9MICO|nr:hypothetical protein LWF01_07505 [Brevibacteriaceae bacterium ZFBP1038]
MALVYQADLRPTKLELLNDWVPRQLWYRGGEAPQLQRSASFRFDDPAGEVGVETLLVQSGEGPVYQVPLTYRGEALPGGEASLIGILEHSVLGRRWVYDACADPVYLAELATTVLNGGTQVQEFVDTDGHPEPREPSAVVSGSGRAATRIAPIDSVTVISKDDSTVIRTNQLELEIFRIPGESAAALGAETLTATWVDGMAPVVLAAVRAA